MNRVVQFDEQTMIGSEEDNLQRLLVEFDKRGRILRELGIGNDGRVAHRYPGEPTLDEYGLMGPNTIAIAGENPSRHAILMKAADLVPLETFEQLWASAGIASSKQASHMAQIEQRPDQTDEEFYAEVDPYDDRLFR